MEDLRDVSFTIPVRIDSDDRINNLKLSVDYISHFFDTNFIICEQDTDKVKDALKGYTFTYIKTSRTDDFIHRTHQLNVMAKHSKTDILVNYDCDVLLNPKQYLESVNLIRDGGADFVFPYNGEFWNIPKRLFPEIQKNYSLAQLNPLQKNCKLFNACSYGGCLFYNKKSFIDAGGENEKFLSWGHEDHERFHRFNKLGYTVKRIDGVLYHLDHSRGINSGNNNPLLKKNAAEFHKIVAMSKSDLREYVNTWSWINNPEGNA